MQGGDMSMNWGAPLTLNQGYCFTPYVQTLQKHSASVAMDGGARELAHGCATERKRMLCSG